MDSTPVESQPESGAMMPGMSVGSHDVFISHSTKDKAVADAVCHALESAKVRCWIAPRDIPPGRDWDEEIVRAIDAVKLVVLVFSANADGSEFVQKEVPLAMRRGRTVIPFRIEPVEPSGGLAMWLVRIHWWDAIDPPREERIGELTEHVLQVLGRSPQHVASSTSVCESGRHSSTAGRPERSPGGGTGPAFSRRRPSAPGRYAMVALLLAMTGVAAIGGWHFLRSGNVADPATIIDLELHVDAGPDLSGRAGETFDLIAGDNSDPDGDSLQYHWMQIAGPAVALNNANLEQASFTPSVAGLYEFSITVTDGRGGHGQDTVCASVEASGVQPVPPVQKPLDTPGPQDVPATLVRSMFDADAEGWSLTNNAAATTPIWSPTGGRAGGFIHIVDQRSTGTNRANWFYWNAPPAFLGDKSAAYGGKLSFHVLTDRNPNAPIGGRRNLSLVKLTGPNTTLVVPLTVLPNRSGWTAYSVPLDTSSGWQHMATSSGATEQEIRNVLQGLSQLQILGDYTTDLHDTGGLDEVVLSLP